MTLENLDQILPVYWLYLLQIKTPSVLGLRRSATFMQPPIGSPREVAKDMRIPSDTSGANND